MKNTIIHELGHALKLSHTFSDSETRYYTLYVAEKLDQNGEGTDEYEIFPLGPQNLSMYDIKSSFQIEVLSVMNYDALKIVNNNLTHNPVTFRTLSPTVLDKFNLIRKWGV